MFVAHTLAARLLKSARYRATSAPDTLGPCLKNLLSSHVKTQLPRFPFGCYTNPDIDQISFIDAARWLAAARDEESLPLLVMHLHRPYRYGPRVQKRRPKQYPLMQTPRTELRKLLANNTDVD